MLAAGCTGLDVLNPICQVGSIGGSIASAGFESVLDGISQWVASGAEWLLGQIGDVMVSTTTVNVGADWFRTHYGQMTALAGVVILPLLLVSSLQAVLRQDAGQLVRTFLLRVPLALLLAGVAIQVVIMGLSITDAMSNAVAGGSGAEVTSLLSGVTTGLVAAAADPTIASFVLLLIGLLIAVAAFVLWLELLIRAAAVYVAVLFLPLALATLVWPAISHWCRRLVETLAALILSKFVIVATLGLAAGAVSSGTAASGSHGSGFSSVLAGGALLIMATFVPFAILRLIPAVEAGAVGHLDGLRSRGTSAMTRLPRTAANLALHQGLQSAGEGRLMAQTPMDADTDTPEGESTVPLMRGDPRSQAVFDAKVAELTAAGPGAAGRDRGPKPVLDAASGPGAAGSGGPGPAGQEPEAQRPRFSWRSPQPTGPATPADAWKWEGVPPGGRIIPPVDPGKKRHYMGDDGHGPQICSLPPSWPPGHPDRPPDRGTGDDHGGPGSEGVR